MMQIAGNFSYMFRLASLEGLKRICFWLINYAANGELLFLQEKSF